MAFSLCRISRMPSLLKSSHRIIAACSHSGTTAKDPSNNVDTHYGKVFSDKVDLPDLVGDSVGPRRLEVLARAAGNDDPHDKRMHPFFKTATKEAPNLVPTHSEKRLLMCNCSQLEFIVKRQWLHKEVPTRCQCGFWFKCSSYDEYFMDLRARLTAAFEEWKNLAEDDRCVENLSADAAAVVEHKSFIIDGFKAMDLESVLPPRSFAELEDAMPTLATPIQGESH